MIADQNYYLTRDGRLCTEEDPAQDRLLVSKGGELPDHAARRYGLLPADPQPDPSVPRPRIDEHTKSFAQRAQEAVAPQLEQAFREIAELRQQVGDLAAQLRAAPARGRRG